MEGLELQIVALLVFVVALLQGYRSMSDRLTDQKSEFLDSKLMAQSRILELEAEVERLRVHEPLLQAQTAKLDLYEKKFKALSEAIRRKVDKKLLISVRKEYAKILKTM